MALEGVVGPTVVVFCAVCFRCDCMGELMRGVVFRRCSMCCVFVLFPVRLYGGTELGRWLLKVLWVLLLWCFALSVSVAIVWGN